MKIIKGHLTATDRQAVAYMIDNGVDHCASPRISWSMVRDADAPVATVTATRKERDDWGRPVTRRSVAVIAA